MLKRLLIVIAALLVFAVPSLADCRKRVIVQQEVAAVAAVVPFVLQIPTYSAGYASPAYGPYDPRAMTPGPMPCDICEQLKRIADSLDRLNGGTPTAAPQPETLLGVRAKLAACEKELADLKRQLGQPVAQPAAQPQAAKVPSSATKCFACHSETTAAASGKGFILFKGKDLLTPAEIGPAKLVKVLTKTNLGQMPPPDNKLKVLALSDEEAGEWQVWASGK